jgi:hypothetical protein
MAGLNSTFTVGGWYGTVPGVAHESLADVCTILDSFQTPFFSSAPKIKVSDVVFSWSVDTLMSPSTTSQLEASAFVVSANTDPARLTNVCQVFRDDIEVTDRARTINPAGIRDFYDHQVMKGFKFLSRSYESWVFQKYATAAATTSATATGNATTAPTASNFRGFSIILSAVNTTTSAVATADIIALSESLFNAGAEPDSMWFAPANKRQFVAVLSANSGNTRNIAAIDKQMIQNVDVYESPFNQLYAVITDRFIPTATVSSSGAGYYIGDRAMAKVAFFRPPQHKPLGKVSDTTRGIVLMDCSLMLDHPSAWGAVTGVINT